VRVHSVHQLPTYVPANLSGHRSAVKAVFFDSSDRTIYAVSRDGAVSVWELRDRPDVEAADVTAAREAVHEGGRSGVGEDRIGTWWEMTARHYLNKGHARVTSAVLHPASRLLVVGFNTG